MKSQKKARVKKGSTYQWIRHGSCNGEVKVTEDPKPTSSMVSVESTTSPKRTFRVEEHELS